VFICETPLILNILPHVDYLFGNESEAEAFAKKQNWQETKMEAIALKLAAHNKLNANKARTVVITQGAQPTVVVVDGKVTTFAVPLLDPKLIVDVNGAGDAFVGGFLSQLVQGKSMADCIRAAQFAAKAILQVSGTILKGKPNFQ